VRGSKGQTGDDAPLEPVAGDRVECRRLAEGRGRIERVLERQTLLDRPPIANCDHVAVVVSWGAPPFSAPFVDRVLVSAGAQGCTGTICLNKTDLLTTSERAEAAAALAPWRSAGYGTVLASAETGEGLADLAAALRGHLTVLAGPSGAGKSRLLHRLIPERPRRSGALSARGGRGRHTTRAVELLPLSDGGWVADAPGFSRLSLEEIEPQDLAGLYPEFLEVGGRCRFRGCRHATEPDCAVRAAVDTGVLDAGRYGRYRQLLEELEARAPRY
jgi:ribosome biogenesis GTPase